MNSTGQRRQESGGHPVKRPLLLTILAVILAIYGAQSVLGVVFSFQSRPLAAARLVIGVAAGAAAWGIWIRRRWALLPFAVCAVGGLGLTLFIALFAAADLGPAVLLRAVLLVVLPAAVLAILLARYIWRSTGSAV
jgi:hypothetical protein